MIVHFMGYGYTACMIPGPPKDWPEGHKWSSDWNDITCPGCLAGKELVHTFRIFADGKAIQCLICGAMSYIQEDVDRQFCPKCGICHEDLWPPARRAMIRKDLLESAEKLHQED